MFGPGGNNEGSRFQPVTLPAAADKAGLYCGSRRAGGQGAAQVGRGGGCSHQSSPPFPAAIKQTSRTRRQPDTHGSGRSGSQIRGTRHPFDFGLSRGHPPEQRVQNLPKVGWKHLPSWLSPCPGCVGHPQPQASQGSPWQAGSGPGPQGTAVATMPRSHLCTLAHRCTRSR